MQTIWSRVAQTRISCRCPHCISTTHAVSRRATASATRRMQRYLTSSTLLYSGIFAAAATFDAGVKKERREQWDRAIADIKQELGQPAGDLNDQLQDAQEHEEEAHQGDTIEFKPFEGLPQEEDAFSRVDIRQPRPRVPTNTGPDIFAYNLSPDSIYALDGMTRKWRTNRPWSEKKLESCRLSMEMLQLQLFQYLHEKSWSQEAADAVPSNFAHVILQEPDDLSRQFSVKKMALRKLAGTNIENIANYQSPEEDEVLCHYTHDNVVGAARISRDLNMPLQNLFEQHASSDITMPALLAQVSYLICGFGAPPDLATFNTLLIGLSRAQQTSLVGNVISAFRASHIRPNEVTLASILNFFTNTNQPDMFTHWIELMRGKHGGLALARSDIQINDVGKSRLLRKEGDPHKVIQLPYPTPDVFTAVIAGVIKFTNFKTAMSICRNMGDEGWGLSIDGLTPLLHDCAERGDWMSGQAVWMQIDALQRISRRRNSTGPFQERIRLETYAAMLRLCSKADKREEFDTYWKEAIGVYRNASDRLWRMVTGRNKRAVAHEIEKLRVHGNGADSRSDSIPDQSARIPIVRDVLRPSLQPIDKEHDQEAVQDDWGPQLDISTTYTNHDRLEAAASQISEERLRGNLPAGNDLDEYELRERPMRIIASAECSPMYA